MRPELAAVVSGGHPREPFAADGRVQPGPHRLAHAFEGEPVDHKFVDGAGPCRQLRPGPRRDCRAVRIVRAGLQLLVARAHLTAAADDPAGERQDHVAHAAHRLGRRIRGPQRRDFCDAADQQVPAGDALDGAEAILADELAVHHRHAPEPPAAQPFRSLEAVAKVAQTAADRDLLVPGTVGEPVVAGGRRASQHALSDAVRRSLGQSLAAEREQQHANAGAAVRRLVRRDGPLDRRLDVAGDDARCVAAHLGRAEPGPVRRLGGDDRPHSDDWKRFGKGIGDASAVEFERRFLLDQGSFHRKAGRSGMPFSS
jgi:hypothetical protein